MRKKGIQKSYAARIKKIFLKNWQLYVLLLPAIIYLFLFNYMPMYGVQIAFRDFSVRKGIWGSEWVGLEHFKRFITYPNFGLVFKNTLWLGIYSLLTFPCAIIFALMLNEVKNIKFKKMLQMISYMPNFLSVVVVCSMIKLFFDMDGGVINSFIEFFGGTRKEFLAMPQYFDELYIWSGVWQSLGFSSIIYLSALSGVPAELVDAAKVDGAGRIKVIWHVNIPSILPTIIMLLILACGGILNTGFEKCFLLQNSLNLSVSQVISTYTYEVGLVGGQFSYSSAIGLFNVVVNFILLAIVNAVSKKVTEVGIW